MTTTTPVVVLLSGGMDSTTLLAAWRDHAVLALGVDYGQRHRRELQAATVVADRLGVRFRVADLAGLRPLLAASSLTSAQDVPEGHYAEETMRATVVPNRNAILLAVAAGAAITYGATAVLTAVHAGDHYVYPDCRPPFIEAMDTAVRLGTEGIGDVRVLAPFASLTKAAIARIGVAVDAPLDASWSCYLGGEVHCGRCGTCVERAEAFHLAGVPDPTTYEDPSFWREAVAKAAP